MLHLVVNQKILFFSYCAACKQHWNACCTIGEAATYETWFGSVHTFRFVSKDFASA
jgi:hypothetical protein